MIVLLFFYTPIARRLGMIRTFQLGIFITFFSLAMFPALNLFATNEVLLWMGFVVTCMVRAFAGQYTFSTVFALISNSVLPQMMGAANGLGQSLVALTRSFSPIVAGVV